MDVLSAAVACLLPIISLQYQSLLHVILDDCSLGHLAQQFLSNSNGTVQSEYEVKSKASEAAAMVRKKEVAALMVDKSALQQQLKVSWFVLRRPKISLLMNACCCC